MIRKIVVIGATGLIGKPVTEELIKAGFEVTVLAREPAKARALFPKAKVEEGDVFDPLSLLRIFEGQDAVYVSLAPARSSKRSHKMPEREGLKNIIETAKHLHLKKIALLSSVVQNYQGVNGFDWWIFQMKKDAVELIKRSGIPYSIFYASTFMESLNRDVIRGSRILLVAGSVAKMWFISAQDYGKQVARAFEISERKNKEYTIQGLEGFTWEEAAKVIMQHSNRSLKVMRAPLSILKLFGMIVTQMNYGAKICEALNKYPEQFESESTWQELGKPTISLADYSKWL